MEDCEEQELLLNGYTVSDLEMELLMVALHECA
jgi:hypothetical protein